MQTLQWMSRPDQLHWIVLISGSGLSHCQWWQRQYWTKPEEEQSWASQQSSFPSAKPTESRVLRQGDTPINSKNVYQVLTKVTFCFLLSSLYHRIKVHIIRNLVVHCAFCDVGESINQSFELQIQPESWKQFERAYNLQQYINVMWRRIDPITKL